MKKNFWGENRSYHLARASFVRKQPRPACVKYDTALETASGNEPDAGIRRIAINRYVDAHADWPSTRTERHAA
jgi:putative two-component system hydrogenase maturation factor HypX/HoxX